MEPTQALIKLICLPFSSFLSLADRLAIPFLISSFLIGLGVYIFSQKKSIPGFVQYCFPKSIYLHPSAILDYKFFYFSNLLTPLFIYPLAAYLSLKFSNILQDLLFGLGVHPLPLFSPLGLLGPLLFSLIYTIALGVAFDFGLYFSHYLSHKIPWLWEFHKVHHSAGTLTPMTVRRMHPMDDILTNCFVGLFVAIVDALLRCFIEGPVAAINVFNINLLFFLFYFLGYHLRHSHVWVDYGKFWDKIIISPAQHQIHHSTSPKHFDKNMGFIFAFWDRMFGTLYVPVGREEITFGINHDGEHLRYSSLARLFFLPFLTMFKHFGKTPSPLNLWLLLIVPFVLSPIIAVAMDKAKPNIFLEDLTSPEVHQLIANGYTRVLVPTGGLEQNGPHMVLGKHNFIIRATSEKIAQRAGHMLVAPVVPYTNCGSVDPPSVHMRFTGSVSLTEDTFASVLECVARSLKQGGVKEIYFLGDHGLSQKVQDKVAAKLTSEWQKDGVKAVNLSDYYFQNGQYMSFRLQGWSKERFGGHARVSDTSELMVVHPEGIRKDLIKLGKNDDGSGVDGDPTPANREIGEQMLDMKIRAAVQQILSPNQAAMQVQKPVNSTNQSLSD
jgi:sterol desaturase/sphingolipid hydroxylase (fatty acid hydroxylase superfamily)/creatinine amidohydrolase/Fe(II)-dependent formamide hydrolase-like protein